MEIVLQNHNTGTKANTLGEINAGASVSLKGRGRDSYPRATTPAGVPTLLLSFFLALACQGMTSKQAIDIIKANIPADTTPAAVTNIVPDNPGGDAPGQTGSPAPAGVVAAGDYTRPSIAVSKSGAYMVVSAEGPKMASVHVWTWSGKKWTGGLAVTASASTAGRTYVTDTVIDEDGWSWTSYRYGNKETGPWHGPGVWIRSPTGAGKSYYPGITLGAARLAFDPSMPKTAILLSKNGEWGAVARDGSVTRRGSFPAGLTGEKFSFAVNGSKWITCHNGCSKQASAVAIGTIAGGSRQTWAAFAEPYIDQKDDLNYPDVAFGPDGSVWCISVLSGRLRLQAIVNGKPRWPVTALADLGPAVKQERCPPRLYTAGGRLWAIWQAPGSAIMLADVEAVLAGQGKATRICAGYMPAVAVDATGKTHLVYLAASTIQHRILQGGQL